MNVVLFEADEIGSPLAAGDPRAIHITRVLRRADGDSFDAGVVNGHRGKARITSIGKSGIIFVFEPTVAPSPPDALHLLLSTPRPQTARKILGEAAALGVASIRFFASERSEPSYAKSTLWSSGEWRRHLVMGAAQAFDTRIPEVAHDASLADSAAALPGGCIRMALDNYEAPVRLGPSARSRPLALAFGPERGWSPSERDRLRSLGFVLAHLGERVLRLETAVVAAIALAKA